jgi:hypothetical protein
MAKRNRKRNSNDLTIAQAEGDVRYGPQVSQIRDLYQQAANQRVSDINAAKQNATSAIAFARAARPEVNAIYKRGANVEKVAATDVANAFAPLSAGADPFRAAAARETQGAKTRMEEARTAARQELVDRATASKAGQGFAINQARQEYGAAKSTLGQKLQDILGQRGSYISGRLGTLANQRAAEDLKVRLAKMGDATTRDIAAAKIEATAEEGAANRKAKGTTKTKSGSGSGGGGGQTPKQRGDFADQVNAAISLARQMKQANTKQDRRAVGDSLLKGRVTPKGGDPNKDAYPKFGQLALTTALDMVYDKHVARPTAAALHTRGINVADIPNVRSYGQWINTPDGRRWRAAQRAPKVTGRPRNTTPNVFTTSPFGRRF